MTSPIEFWFEFSSPYAYFTAVEIESRLSRFDRPIHWRPFLLGVVFKTTGMGSLSRTPLRGDYARHDWCRIAKRLDVPFNLTNNHPFRSQAVARAYYWFFQRDKELAISFAKAAFNAYFADGDDLGDERNIKAIAAEFTSELEELDAWLSSDLARQILRKRTAEAIAKGVFGSPFFLVDAEPFWGWDRLPMLEDWLEKDCKTSPDKQRGNN